MRVGIITHHYVKNYGAFLQMKAMYEKLRELYPSAEICVVNYVVGKHWRKNFLHVLHYRPGIDNIKTYAEKIKQFKIFSEYERMIPRTKRAKTVKDIESLKLDLIVFGSDEIWNFYSSGFNVLKYGYGFDSKKQKMIAYAPSVGSAVPAGCCENEFREGLENFIRLSGRDDATVSFVKKRTGRDVNKMLDPTFLYDFGQDIEKNYVKPQPFKYILIYDAKLTELQQEDLRKYADRNGLKILGAGDYKSFYDKVTICITPYEWVNLFKNAEKIITGTFHGTVFSIKYNKTVVCYPTEDNRIRKIKSLLLDMHIECRLLKQGNESGLCDLLEKKVDYSYANKYIAEKIAEADRFLLPE